MTIASSERIADAGEILSEYRKTRFAERFYNMKIGIAWADVSNRLTAAEVLAHCGDLGLLEDSTEHCTMGVDTGKQLHVVVSRWISGRQGEEREGLDRYAPELRGVPPV